MILHITDWISFFGYDGITFGKHVFLTEEASKNRIFLKHEEMHVTQYKRYGFLGFLFRYVWFHLKYGYENNPLEIEARNYAKSM